MEYQFILYKYMLVICTFGSIKCDDGGTHIKRIFHYNGPKYTTFACNGSDVINITDLKLAYYPTNCATDRCNLTDSDRDHIDMCNGNSSCTIPIDEMSPCVKNRGFFCVNYLCERNVVHCNFENDHCEWILEENGWKIVEAKDQKPYKDHTTGSDKGRYWYVNTGDNNRSFHTEPIHGSFKQCLSFYYHISSYPDSIMLNILHMNGTVIEKKYISMPVLSNLWERKIVQLNDVMDYKLIIEAKGHSTGSTFVIDDFIIVNMDCQELKEFDFESNWCSWKGSKHWERKRGKTQSDKTGPITDHTTTDNGYYVYMEASNMNNKENTTLTSPTVTGYGDMCFLFWYYMYGEEMGSLRVYIESNTERTELFTKSGNQGQLWHGASIDVYADGEFKILVEGQRGDGWKSDIAIDDISLLPGNCLGIVQHHQRCNSLDKKVKLSECSSYYLSNIHVNFDPSNDVCKDFLNNNSNDICNNSSYSVFCDSENVTRQPPSCFNLNNLLIEYTCTDLSKMPVANTKRSDTDSTGVIVGVVVALLLVIGVTFGVFFIIYRRRKSQGTAENKNSTNDYAASWNSASERTTLHAAQPLSEETNHAFGINRITTNNPSYGQGYIITASNELSTKQDTEYMNVPEPDGTPKHKNFKVLDPAETGLNCTNQSEYELASAIDDRVEDDYAESGVGVYDISGNNRHKEKEKDTIYDHSVDDTYDTSNRGRPEDLGDYTYNHVFGKQTEDEYDIAGSS